MYKILSDFDKIMFPKMAVLERHYKSKVCLAGTCYMYATAFHSRRQTNRIIGCQLLVSPSSARERVLTPIASRKPIDLIGMG